MSFLSGNRSKLMVVAALTVAVSLGAGVSWAVAKATPNVYTGCLQSGQLTRVNIGTSPTSPCPVGATKVSWNQTGPQGDQGRRGHRGSPGLPGADAPLSTFSGNKVSATYGGCADINFHPLMQSGDVDLTGTLTISRVSSDSTINYDVSAFRFAGHDVLSLAVGTFGQGGDLQMVVPFSYSGTAAESSSYLRVGLVVLSGSTDISCNVTFAGEYSALHDDLSP